MKRLRIALMIFSGWLIGWTIVLLFAGVANAGQYCFEQDAESPDLRNKWTRHHLVLWGSKPRTSAGGTPYIALQGYGYDDAKKPGGGTDLVPVHGGAVKDVDGSWIVSLSGTLMQFSALEEFGGASAYYLISLWWSLDAMTLEGYGHMGNVTAGFNAHLPGANDDSYGVIVWPVECSELR